MNQAIIKSIIQNLYPGLIAIAFLYTFIAVDQTFPGRILRLFINATTATLCLLITDGIDFYCKSIQSYQFLRQVVGSLAFSTRIAIVCMIVIISYRTEPKVYKFLYSLAIINSIVSLLNIKFRHLFTINADASWTPGPLFFFPYLIIAIYVFFFIRSMIKNIHTNNSESKIIFSVCMFSFLANILEIATGLNFALSLTFCICIIFYYLCLNVQMYKRDTLTYLLNRRSFYKDTMKQRNKNLTLISMDLNNLKEINDTYGHSAGDKAICTVVKFMNDAFARNARIYRTGGDEFFAVFFNKKQNIILQCLASFKDKLESSQYSVACGMVDCYPDDDFEKILETADKYMYEDKRRTKELLKTANTIKEVK